MSLIRIRRERRELGSRAKKPRLSRLLLTLALVVFAIWWLSRAASGAL